MGTYTTPDNLYLPERRERGWHAKVVENFQTLQDIVNGLREAGTTIHDVRSFGADPTGVTDSTSAFADWMAQLNSAPGQAGYVGAGAFKVLPDALGGVRDDTTIFGSHNASQIISGGVGEAIFDFTNGGTGVQGLRVEGLFADLDSTVQDFIHVDQLSPSPRLNYVVDCTVWRYLRYGVDAGANANSQAVWVLGGDFRGSPMASSPDAEQCALYFRASDCEAIGVSIVRNRLASVLIEGSTTIRGGHYFASGDVWTDGSQPTCVLIRKGGLHEILGLYADNAVQNAFVVVRPRSTDQPVDRVTIHGGKYTQAVQQRDTDGDLVSATYPLFIADDADKRVAAVIIEDVMARASASSHFTHIVDWSATTAAASICDGNLVQACDDFYTNPPPAPGNNIITADTSSGSPRSSAAEAGQRPRSIWVEAFNMGLDSATKSTLGTVPDALTRLAEADASTTGSIFTRAIPDDAVPGEPLNLRILWSPSTSETSAVQWSVDAYILAAGASVTSTGTTTAYTGDAGAKSAGHPVFEAAQEILAAVDPGDVIRVDIRRLGSDGSDTFAGQVNFLGCWLDYTAAS